MLIFKEAECIMAVSGLGTNKFVQIAGQHIPRLFVRLHILLFPILCSVMEIILCINGYANGFVTTLENLGFLLTYSSGILVYISLLAKSNAISAVFNYLESVINTSNLRLGYFCIYFYYLIVEVHRNNLRHKSCYGEKLSYKLLALNVNS